MGNTNKPRRTSPRPRKPSPAKIAPPISAAPPAGTQPKWDTAHLASIVQHSQDAFIAVSTDGIVQSWNPGAQQLLGYTAAEIVGKSVAILVPEDRSHEPRELFEILLRGERVPPFETVRRRKDGTLIDVELTLSPIMEESRCIAFVTQVRDISRRKRAERALRVSEERYALAEKATNDGVWDWSPSRHELFVSPRWKALLGFDHDELPNTEAAFFARIHPDDDASTRKAFRLHLEQNRPCDIELRLRCKDGCYRWFRSRGEAIRDEEGRPIRMVGSINDISQRREIEERLRHQARLLDEVSDAIISTDGEFRITDWNRAAERTFGWASGQAVGRDVDELLGAEYPGMTREDAVRDLKAAGSTSMEVILRDQCRNTLIFHRDATLIKDNAGHVIGTVLILRNITERRHAEEALRASDERFRRSFELGLIGMAISSPTKAWVEVNDQLCQTLGYERSELVTLTWAELTHPADFAADLANFDRVMAGEIDGYSMEKRFIRKDGEVIHTAISVKCLRRADGSVDYFVALIQDITARMRAESALKGSYDLLAKVSRQVPGVIYQVQLFPDGRSCFPYASEGIREIYEVTPEQVRENAAAVFAILHPDDYDGIAASIEKSARTLKPWHYEFRVVLPKQGVRWRLGDSRPERLADGSTLWHGFITDITERKQVQDALKASEQQLSAIYSNVSGIIFCLTVGKRERYRFTTVNEAFLQATGFARDQVVGKFVEDVIPKPSRALVLRKYREAVRTRNVVRWEEVSNYPTGEKHGDVSISPIMDGTGKVTHLIGMVHDITARKQAEAALRDSEERSKAFLENSATIAWMKDADGRHVYLSRNYEKRFGVRSRDWIGKTDFQLWPRTVARQFRENDRAVLDTWRAIEVTEAALTADGKKSWWLNFKFPFQDSSGRRFVGGLGVDITARKQAEDALRQLNADLEKRVSDRTASLLSSTESLLKTVTALHAAREDRRRLEKEIIEISESERGRIGRDLHDDLGQQLAGINWLNSTLERQLRARSAPEADSAARIADLLNGALQLTRSLARGLHPVPAEPGGLMSALGELAVRSSELFRVRCRFTSPRRVHVHQPVIATHLYRIAQEAVTNAVKHGKAKRIQITLSSSSKRILLSVSDDGKGLKKPGDRNEGLGMRIMKYRAETLRGSLEFQGKPGGGTRLVFALPLPRRAQGSQRENPEEKAAGAEPASTTRITRTPRRQP
jgi:PAS domain S-box-containing protein